MTSIPKVAQTVSSFTQQGVKTGKFANKIKNFVNPNKSENILATIALTSVIAKDAVGCYYYVTQSLSNEKIPEDKRKFVAALDLANGILNVGVQTLGTLALSPFFDKIFDKFVQPSLEAKKLNNVVSTSRTGFKILAGLALTQIIIKRTIVPLIATPMASKFKNKFAEKGKAQGGDTVELTKEQKIAEEKAIIDSTMPAAKLSKVAQGETNLLARAMPQK